MSGSKPGSGRSLRDALQRARLEAAEHSQATVVVRDAEIARLELLKDALAPVLRDVPGEVDLFDFAVVPGDPPRLFIDMVAHVALDRDKRTYRLLRDTRTGRQLLAENQDPKLIVAAATAYIARRLVEREQVLAESRLETPVAEAATSEPAPQRGWIALAFALGLLLGAGAVFAFRWAVP